MSVDITAGIVAFLKADSGVSALTDGRVFGVEVPGSEASAMPRKAVVARPSGGASFASGSFVEHETQRLDILAYGETVFEAERLRRAVFDAIRAKRRGKVGATLIHWIDPAGGWATQREADVSWPVAFQSVNVFFALQPA